MRVRTVLGERGITLVALVVTIVVLLILAGVSVATLTGSNGILTKASETKTKVETAQEKEELQMAVMASQMEETNTLEIKKENLENAIKQQFGTNKDFAVTDNGDGSFLVNMNDTQRMYYVDETGEVIGDSKILKISNEEELKAFRDDVNSGNTYEGWYVYLANDITLDINEEWEPIGKYTDADTSINDTTNMSFKGIFGGNNYTINGLYINSQDDYKGLFGYNVGKIKNLKIGNSQIISSGSNIGGITALNLGEIKNCTCSIEISGNNYIGGICARNSDSGKIINCSNLGKIEGTILNASNGIVGGLIGSNNGLIENSRNSGEIVAKSNVVGGIVGENLKGTINLCFNEGKVSSSGNSGVGGIVATQNGSAIVNACYNKGSIKGNRRIGGIVGDNAENCTVNSCYNIGEIIGNKETGSIVGDNRANGNVKNCYSLNSLSINIIGNNSGIIDEVSSNKSEEYMKNNEFISLLNTNSKNFKYDEDNINNGYPILAWQRDPTIGN